MPAAKKSSLPRPAAVSRAIGGVALSVALALSCGGCVRVKGNYPPPAVDRIRVTARCTGAGFQLLAGPRLQVDRVESELGRLPSQGLAPHDPRIIARVARRRHVPPALLADRSGSSYYRFTARLEAGVHLTLRPGALELTVKNRQGAAVVRDLGYLVEDRRLPGGCRPPAAALLLLGSLDGGGPRTADFLVRLPARGEIIHLAIVPSRCGIVNPRARP